MLTHIFDWFDRSSKYDRSVGSGWYQSAREECFTLADLFSIERKRVVWAVAALSPQSKWERNIAAARAVIQGHISFPGVYSANIEKAVHILWDEEPWEQWLSGPKVTCFAHNIWGDPETVTVDTWAWRVWAGVSDLWAKPPAIDRIYDQIAGDYRYCADYLGYEARQLQAITWTTIRRIANGRVSPQQLTLDI